jgi:hypothetical protein
MSNFRFLIFVESYQNCRQMTHTCTTRKSILHAVKSFQMQYNERKKENVRQMHNKTQNTLESHQAIQSRLYIPSAVGRTTWLTRTH